MTASLFIETRITTGLKVTPKQHFFFSGPTFAPRSGKWARDGDGRIKGVVKMTVLANGNISLRSTGPNGNGRLVHVSPTAMVVIDGEEVNIHDYMVSEVALMLVKYMLGL